MLNCKYTLPLFMCNFLCSKDSRKILLFATYENNDNFPLGTKILWKYIPDKIRLQYLPLIESKLNDHINVDVNDKVQTTYEDCDLYTPPSYFVDQGEESREFEKDIGERTLEGLLQQLHPRNWKDDDEKSIIMLDVFYPWSGTDFSFKLTLVLLHSHCSVTLNMPRQENF